jgi:hypothetical protein
MDVEDAALLFLEEEIGRFDWQANWEKVKSKGGIQDRIQHWLSVLGVDLNPNEIVSYLDRLAVGRAGRWR